MSNLTDAALIGIFFGHPFYIKNMFFLSNFLCRRLSKRLSLNFYLTSIKRIKFLKVFQAKQVTLVLYFFYLKSIFYFKLCLPWNSFVRYICLCPNVAPTLKLLLRGSNFRITINLPLKVTSVTNFALNWL